ncbi:hypothetical protein TWF694_001946 [Orbilia ellipsospora]|uniref:CHAT domain-containing protein n=1 Tax=Orbilia ellipsospora TaxID=2528407 RepID=A0AAV9X6Q1_9PEZI
MFSVGQQSGIRLQGRAVRQLFPLFIVDPEMVELVDGMVNDELLAFAETLEEPHNHTDAELFIFVHFLIFCRIGSISHIEKSIAQSEGWMATTSETLELSRRLEITDGLVSMRADNPWENAAVELLNKSLGQLEVFKRTGDKTALDNAFSGQERAFSMIPQDNQNMAVANGNYGLMHKAKYQLTNDIADLEKSIAFAWKAANMFPEGHNNRASFLNNICGALEVRYRASESIADLEEMVRVSSMLVDSMSPDDPSRPHHLFLLAKHCSKVFSDNASIEAINQAIESTTTAIDTAPKNHPEQPEWSGSLATFLGSRYLRLGNLADLNQAIEISEGLVQNLPPDHGRLNSSLSTLSFLLTNRYKAVGAMEDLSRALEIAEIIVPDNLTAQAKLLRDRGIMLQYRFNRNKNKADIDEAIELLSTANDIIELPILLSNLGTMYLNRFEQYKEPQDILDAIEVGKRAVNSTPPDSHALELFANHLGVFYMRKYSYLTEEIEDLDESIKFNSMSVDATPPQHWRFAGNIMNLATALITRYKVTHSAADLEKSKLCFKRAIDCGFATSVQTFLGMISNISNFIIEELSPEEASDYLEKAVHMLSRLSSRSLQQGDKQHLLSQFPNVASNAAAAALNAEKGAFHALQLLETGRGLITDHLMKMRTDISSLEQKDPALAAEFVELREQLDLSGTPKAGIQTNSDLEDAASAAGPSRDQRIKAEKRFEALCEKIRQLPGFDRFLLSLTAEEMMSAADPDPIAVINISSIRCDAFLIEKNQIRHLELPNLTYRGVAAFAEVIHTSKDDYERTWAVEVTLQRMWDDLAKPVLDALGFAEAPAKRKLPQHRIWWIPTGPLCQLPLHAAGYHFESPMAGQSVLDRVMSSYSTSIKSLIHGRQRSNKETTSRKILILSVPETEGMPTLPNVTEEANMLEKLCKSLQLDPIKPRSTATRDEIMDSIRDCKVFHFAGHGFADASDPSKSGLLLKEGRSNMLRISDLQDKRYQLHDNPPFLAYLSACSTGAIEAERLLDEGINLASAFQLAGFRHVVGTLWEVSDRYCVDIAMLLYHNIRKHDMTDRSVCIGLHLGIRTLRDRAVANYVEDLKKMREEEEEGIASEPEEHIYEIQLPDGLDEDEMSLMMSLFAMFDQDVKSITYEGEKAPESKPDSTRGKAPENDTGGAARNAKVLKSQPGIDSVLPQMYWVPFMHFGV